MLLLQALVEGVKKQGEVAKMRENDDIEAYLTTFEWLMVAYQVKKDKWAFKLAPQLVGKAQQAYVGLSVTVNEFTTRGRYKRQFSQMQTKLNELLNKAATADTPRCHTNTWSLIIVTRDVHLS